MACRRRGRPFVDTVLRVREGGRVELGNLPQRVMQAGGGLHSASTLSPTVSFACGPPLCGLRRSRHRGIVAKQPSCFTSQSWTFLGWKHCPPGWMEYVRPCRAGTKRNAESTSDSQEGEMPLPLYCIFSSVCELDEGGSHGSYPSPRLQL